MRRRRVLAYVLGALAALVLAPAGPAHTQDTTRPRAGEDVLAVVGGDVWTGTGSVLRHATILCRGGKIESVGVDVPVPQGARVVDATGRRVLPGFVAPLGTGMGVALGRPRQGERYADCLDPNGLGAELALAAGITAFHHEGERRGIWGSTNAVVKPAHRAPELMVLKEPAALTVAWNSAASERTAFEQQLARARKWMKDGARGASPAPQPVVDALQRKIPVRISAPTRGQIGAALRFAKDWDVKLVLTDCHEAWTMAEEIAAAGAIAIVEPRARRWPQTGEERESGSTIEACAMLEQAGARFCVLPPGAMGAPGFGISLGGISGRDLLTYPWDGAFAIRGGATEEAAFRAITSTAAEALGVEDRIGSIAPGRDADLVVYQGDPFDYRMWAEVTVVSGRVLYERSKSKLFSHLPDPRDNGR